MFIYEIIALIFKNGITKLKHICKIHVNKNQENLK